MVPEQYEGTDCNCGAEIVRLRAWGLKLEAENEKLKDALRWALINDDYAQGFVDYDIRLNEAQKLV